MLRESTMLIYWKQYPMLYLIAGVPPMTENSQRCAHCNGLLQSIDHPSSCLWNLGVVCVTCGRETYIGEVYSTWKEGESPVDLLHSETIPQRKSKYI